MSDSRTHVIFGATGNLSRVKRMPALYHLDAAGKLHPETRIVAMGRRSMNVASPPTIRIATAPWQPAP